MTRGGVEIAIAQLNDFGFGKKSKDGINEQDSTQHDVLLSSVISAPPYWILR